MTDLVKGVLGGAWSLIIGWILPTFIFLQLVAWLLAPSWAQYKIFGDFLSTGTAERQAALIAVAAVLGLVLAAVKTPLYRLLEGYWLWPQWLADLSTKRQRAKAKRYAERSEEARVRGKSIRYALVYERVQRFPVGDDEYAPTALGNSIRRFELYAFDRYKLDSQLLWHHLAAAAPDRLVKAQDDANTNVDFFVCLVYGFLAVSLGAAGTLALGAIETRRVLFALALGLVAARIAYRLAIVATDEWDRTVRAMVDHGRLGVAKIFGLEVPKQLKGERDMWRAVNTIVRRPFSYSEARNVPQILDAFRVTPGSTSSGDGAGLPSAQAADQAQPRHR